MTITSQKLKRQKKNKNDLVLSRLDIDDWIGFVFIIMKTNLTEVGFG